MDQGDFVPGGQRGGWGLTEVDSDWEGWVESDRRVSGFLCGV